MNRKTIEKSFVVAISAVTLVFATSGCDKSDADDAKQLNPAPAKGDESVVSAPVKVEGVKPAETAISAPGATEQPAPVKVEKKELSKVVVTVDGKELMRTELNKELKMFTDSPQFAALPPQRMEMMRKQIEARITERFINQTVLTEAADKKNIKITDADVDKAIEKIKTQMPPNAPSLDEALKQRGMTMEELRKNLAGDLKIRELLKDVTKDATNVTDEAVVKYYNENKERFAKPETVHARHILVKVDKGADDATKAAKKAEIEGYRKQLLEHPEDFAKIAEEHSDCPSGKKGGDLGTFQHGQMVPSFDKAAFSQATNAIGPVIESPFGYHIVQVLEHNPAGEVSLDEVKDRIKDQLAQQNGQKVVEDYIEKLRKDAKISYGDKK